MRQEGIVPRTYEPIASQTLGSDTATVTFDSLAGTYTDLRLIFYGYTTRTASNVEAVTLRFNNDTGSNYSWTRLLGSGSATESSGSGANSTSIVPGRPNTNVSSNTDPGTITIDIFSYANTNVFKTVLGAHAGDDSNSHAVGRHVGLWRSTNAITRLDLAPVNGPNFKSGSTFALYGIKAA